MNSPNWETDSTSKTPLLNEDPVMVIHEELARGRKEEERNGYGQYLPQSLYSYQQRKYFLQNELEIFKREVRTKNTVKRTRIQTVASLPTVVDTITIGINVVRMRPISIEDAV